MREIIRSSNDRAFTGMPDNMKKQLAADLVLAAISARAGIRLSDAMPGSRVKRAARVVDLLCYDVCAAAWRAGLGVGVDRDPTVWPAQCLAWRLARALGLIEDNNTLERAMRRVGRTLSASAPNDGIAAAWLDGRLLATASPRSRENQRGNSRHTGSEVHLPRNVTIDPGDSPPLDGESSWL
jgi:hypothetical protein